MRLSNELRNLLSGTLGLLDERDWAATQPDFATVWRKSTNGTWMLELVARKLAGPPKSDERKRLVLTACACAQLRNKKESTHESILVAERWANGDETISFADLRKASSDFCSYLDEHAGYGAPASLVFTINPCDIASVAWYAFSYALLDNSMHYEKQLANCAKIVRRYYPKPPVIDECSALPERRRNEGTREGRFTKAELEAAHKTGGKSDREAQQGDALAAIPTVAVQPVKRQGTPVTPTILEDCLPGTLGIAHDFRGEFWVQYAVAVNNKLEAAAKEVEDV